MTSCYFAMDGTTTLCTADGRYQIYALLAAMPVNLAQGRTNAEAYEVLTN